MKYQQYNFDEKIKLKVTYYDRQTILVKKIQEMGKFRN